MKMEKQKHLDCKCAKCRKMQIFLNPIVLYSCPHSALFRPTCKDIFNMRVWEYILLHYLSISSTLFYSCRPYLPICTQPLLHKGVGAVGALGGLGPDEAEKGATAELSSPSPRIMNNATEKYIYLLIAPAPWLRQFSLARVDAALSPPHHNAPPQP